MTPIGILLILYFLRSIGQKKQEVSKAQVFTGLCTHYKVDMLNSPSQPVVVFKGIGRVEIDRQNRKLKFLLNNELVFIYTRYISYMDYNLQEEKFTFDSDAEAICYHKEKEFVLYTEMMFGGKQCQEYEIVNFRTC